MAKVATSAAPPTNPQALPAPASAATRRMLEIGLIPPRRPINSSAATSGAPIEKTTRR